MIQVFIIEWDSYWSLTWIHLPLAWLLTRVIRGFEIRADVFEFKPRGFEFAARVERGLVHVVPARRICAGPERVNRKCPNLRRKLIHADIRSTSNTVPPFLSANRRRVEREDSAIVTIHAANSNAGLCILKVVAFAFVTTLQPADLAPRNFPRTEITFERSHNLR